MVQPMQCGNLEPDERNSYPRGQRSDRAPVEAARKFIRAAALEQVVRNNPALSQHVIVRDHHARDGAQKNSRTPPASRRCAARNSPAISTAASEFQRRM